MKKKVSTLPPTTFAPFNILRPSKYVTVITMNKCCYVCAHIVCYDFFILPYIYLNDIYDFIYYQNIPTICTICIIINI